MTDHEETSEEMQVSDGVESGADDAELNAPEVDESAGSVSQSGEHISSLVGYLSRSLVRGGKDQITVRHATGAHDGEIKVTVTVPQGELGKVIGRGGRTATAIRTIVGAAAQRSGLSAQVEFSDGRPGGGRGRPSRGGNGGGRRGGPRRDDRPRRQG
ncbi:KH domain-containing protein [Ferrimicrobium acidiphilum]|uniref:KH domain-containing protein n=2 Tax=Ferrimicrobium acidiphilum TaxID=121039 RepID=UPI0023F1951B|nr:KH domain-containing protein [Ferrimicrobium acidiphilum]